MKITIIILLTILALNVNAQNSNAMVCNVFTQKNKLPDAINNVWALAYNNNIIIENGIQTNTDSTYIIIIRDYGISIRLYNNKENTNITKPEFSDSITKKMFQQLILEYDNATDKQKPNNIEFSIEAIVGNDYHYFEIEDKELIDFLKRYITQNVDAYYNETHKY